MSTLQGNEQWLEEQQAEFASRTGAVLAFWPEFRSTVNRLLEEEPAKGRVAVHSSEKDPNLLTLSAGLFDLKLACDTLSDTVFYAFTSSTLKTLVPRESAIFSNGQLNLVRGYWGVIDSPGPDVAKVFADDPQTVEHFPLAIALRNGVSSSYWAVLRKFPRSKRPQLPERMKGPQRKRRKMAAETLASRIYAELWISFAALIRSYVAAHDLSKPVC